MVEAVPGRHRITLGADKGYDAGDFVADLRALKVTPHVAQNTSGRRLCNDNSEVRPASTTMSGEALGVSGRGSSRRGVWRC
jgi:hypothetical protein